MYNLTTIKQDILFLLSILSLLSNPSCYSHDERKDRDSNIPEFGIQGLFIQYTWPIPENKKEKISKRKGRGEANISLLNTSRWAADKSKLSYDISSLEYPLIFSLIFKVSQHTNSSLHDFKIWHVKQPEFGTKEADGKKTLI